MSFRGLCLQRGVKRSLRLIERRARCSSTQCPTATTLLRAASIKPSRCRYNNVRDGAYSFFSTLANDEYEQYRHVSEEVVKLIQQENAQTHRYIDQELKDEIAAEILKAYESAGVEDVPELGPTGQYLYSTQDSDGRRCYQRRHITSRREQTVLDINFHKHQLHAMSLSVQETFVAYLISPMTEPSQTIVNIRHLNTGREFVLPTNDLTVSNIEWGPLQENGSNALFFTSSNDNGRPYAVHVCCIDENGEVSPPQCLYQNNDEAVMVDIQRTKGCKYVAIYASTKTSSEIYMVGSVQQSPILVRSRQEGVLYHLDVGVENNVFLLAHAAEPNHESGLSEEMSLFETTVSALPLQETFGNQVINSNDNDEYIIADMDVFRDFVALYERSSIDGRQRIALRLRSDTSGDAEGDMLVPLPAGSGDCAVLSSGGNMFYNSKGLRFRVESPCNSGRTYSYNTMSGDVELLSGGIDSAPYVEKQVFVTSADGTQVPMSILHLENESGEPIATDKPRPTVLVGYGSYGEFAYHGFDPTIMPLLNRGYTIAYAHTRGGGELGRAWYRAGRLYQKERAIEDYIACAEALVGDLGITKPRLLTGKAFSAGGVTVAGAMVRRPSLFGSVVLTNPFLDVTTTMSNAHLALTEHEFNEWGDILVDNKAAKSVHSYCPMAYVTLQEYPKILLVGALDDMNVPFWHPLTFCLKIRGAIQDFRHLVLSDTGFQDDETQSVLLHIEKVGGHQLHGTKLDVSAMETAFIIQCQGIS